MYTWGTSRKAGRRWYFGVACSSCGTPILFRLDRSDGTAPASKSLRLVLTCAGPGCGKQADYTETTVTRYQEHPAAAGVAAKVSQS